MPDHDLPPPIDPVSIANLREIGGDSDEFIAEIAQMFREDTPPRFEELEACLTRGDAPGLAKVAHSLKGSASNFGAARFRTTAEKLEHLGKSGDLTGAREALDDLRTEFARILDALESLLKSG